MKKNIIILLLSILISLHSISQTYTISGIVQDSTSGETLVGVIISEQSKKISTLCNEYGFYSLSLPKGENTLTIIFSGYKTKTIKIDIEKNIKQNIYLQKSEIELQQVVVKGNSPRINTVNLPMAKIIKMPVVAGETDVLKSLQLTPGITSGNEGSASLNVRGGSPDQNLFLLDGIPVYNVNHVFGFFSVFNTEALKSVKLIKGGIPAEYSGRASSVIDLYMKEGDLHKIHGNFTVGLIASKFLLQGPLKKNKSSFLLTARRSYLDLLFRPFSKKIADNTITGFYFYDLNAKWNYKFSDKSRLFISFYTGNDKGYIKSNNDDDINIITESIRQELHWGNVTGALRWNKIISQKISLNNTFYYTNYNYLSLNNYFLEVKNDDGDTITKTYDLQTGSGIEDIGYKFKIDWFQNKSNKLKLGLQASKKNFYPSFNSQHFYNNSCTGDTIEFLEQENADIISAIEFSLFAEENLKFGFINSFVGFNANTFYVNQKLYKYFEPRINLIFNINRQLNLQVSYSSVHQYLHLLTNSGLGMPTDLWVPSTEKLKPISSEILDCGLKADLGETYQLEISVYYKSLENMIKYKAGTDFLDVKTDWQDKITTGKGFGYGLEFLLQKSKGKITGRLAYTYSRSFRTFAEINSGKQFPYRYDRPHNLNIQAQYHLSKKILITANWILMSGQNFTLPTAYFIISDRHTYRITDVNNNFYSDYNNLRFPTYHRLDLAVNYTRKRKKTTRLWSIGIYNVYNRLNPFYIEASNKPNTLTGVSFAPIMPFISYSIKF